MGYGLVYMGGCVDAYTTLEDAEKGRRELWWLIQTDQIPDFLTSDDFDPTDDPDDFFHIVEGDYR